MQIRCLGKSDKKVDRFLHAVQGKPPSNVTGRVGAVGQIHLICVKEFEQLKVLNGEEN